MRIENATAGMVLNQDIFDERGSLLLEKGTTLTNTYIERLKVLHISTIHIVDKFSQSPHVQTAISPELRSEMEIELTTLFSLQDYDLFNYKLLTPRFEKLSITLHNIIDEVDCNTDNILNTKVQQFSENDITHAANVCLTSLITGIYLKFSRQVLHNLAFGALLHDLGKMLVSPNESQTDPYLHTLYGRHLLLKCNINSSAAIIAAQHHEHYDGSGYPLGLSDIKLHPLSKIVSIADYYDNALTAAASEGISLNETVEAILAQGSTTFDPHMLHAFFNTNAVFPVGA